MENTKNNSAFKMIVNIILLVLGIVLIAVPESGMQGITIVVGIGLVIYGIVVILMHAYKRNNGGDAPDIVVPIVWLVVGILLLIFNSFFANILLPIVIGAWMIIMGAASLSSAYSLLAKILTVIAIVLGVIIIVGVFVSGMNIVGTLLGICMLIYGIVSIMQWIAIKSAEK